MQICARQSLVLIAGTQAARSCLSDRRYLLFPLSTTLPCFHCPKLIASYFSLNFAYIHSPASTIQSCQQDHSTFPEPLYYLMSLCIIILQYNVDTADRKVLTPLLTNHHISLSSVITVENFWHNPHIYTS